MKKNLLKKSAVLCTKENFDALIALGCGSYGGDCYEDFCKSYNSPDFIFIDNDVNILALNFEGGNVPRFILSIKNQDNDVIIEDMEIRDLIPNKIKEIISFPISECLYKIKVNGMFLLFHFSEKYFVPVDGSKLFFASFIGGTKIFYNSGLIENSFIRSVASLFKCILNHQCYSDLFEEKIYGEVEFEKGFIESYENRGFRKGKFFKGEFYLLDGKIAVSEKTGEGTSVYTYHKEIKKVVLSDKYLTIYFNEKNCFRVQVSNDIKNELEEIEHKINLVF